MREISAKETGRLFECLEALAEHHNKVSEYFKEYYPMTPSGQKTKQFAGQLPGGYCRYQRAEGNK